MVKLPWTYKSERFIVYGTTNYTLWYGDNPEEDQETNVVIVRAKELGRSGAGYYQALAYMGKFKAFQFMFMYLPHFAHRYTSDGTPRTKEKASRADTAIFGIATDSYLWYCIHIDNDTCVRYLISLRRLKE